MYDLLHQINEIYDLPPEEINCGDCVNWARLACQKIPHAIPYISLAGECHAFVQIDDLFYDAECLNGVSNPLKLPFFIRIIKTYPNEEFEFEKLIKVYDKHRITHLKIL